MKLIAFLFLFIATLSARAESCRPFVLETKVDRFSVGYERTCLESEVILRMSVKAGKREVSVDTGTLYSSEISINKAILKRIVNGTSDSDNSTILRDIIPALQRGDVDSARRFLTEMILRE